MTLTRYEIKQRHWARKRERAPVISCACGCGTTLKAVDEYGRPQSYINGHNGRKYEDPKQYKREWNHRHRPERIVAKTERAHRLKGELIRAKGGRCMSCGCEYDGSNGAMFQFHHRDPKQKTMPLNLATLYRVSEAKVLAEAAKCDLLCGNCHMILHGGEY